MIAIQSNIASSYQEVALLAIQRVLVHTHGRLFADNFLAEYRAAILEAVWQHFCSKTTHDLLVETERLKAAYREDMGR